MSPARAPPGDSVIRCRDVIDVIISVPNHKYNRERNELLQLLSHPHMQVSCMQQIQIFLFYIENSITNIKEEKLYYLLCRM